METVLNNFSGNYPAMFVAWILMNLLLYVAVGAVFIRLWDLKNAGIVYENDLYYRMALKESFPELSDEELSKKKPPLLGTIYIAAGGLGVKRVEDYLVDGPHINNGLRGIFGKKLLKFSVKLLVDERKLTAKDVKYLLVHLILSVLTFLFWGLLPYSVAMFKHYKRIVNYIMRIGKDPVVTAQFYAREDREYWEDDIKKLHEIIEKATDGGKRRIL